MVWLLFHIETNYSFLAWFQWLWVSPRLLCSYGYCWWLLPSIVFFSKHSWLFPSSCLLPLLQFIFSFLHPYGMFPRSSALTLVFLNCQLLSNFIALVRIFHFFYSLTIWEPVPGTRIKYTQQTESLPHEASVLMGPTAIDQITTPI